MSKKAVLTLLSLVVFISFGCGDDDNGQNPTPSDVVVTIQPATLVQGVGLTNIFVAKVTGAADTSVTWSVNDIPGGDSTTVGKITIGGRYRAPEDVPDPAVVIVKATSVEDPDAYDTAELTIVSGNGTGIPAAYSTGPQLVEGPVFHGWWTPCAGTEHNW